MSTYSVNEISLTARNVVVVLLLGLLGGCASSPSDSGREPVEGGIHIVENRSVDASVRDDFNAAIALLEQQQYEPAVQVLKKVIAGSQNNSAPYINIAIAYVMLDETELAEENFKQALSINPNHPVAINEYALLLRRAGRYDEARALYDRAVSKYPEYMPVRKNYGILCELYLDDAPCALEHYEVYSENTPEDEDVKLWITTLKQKLGV